MPAQPYTFPPTMLACPPLKITLSLLTTLQLIAESASTKPSTSTSVYSMNLANRLPFTIIRAFPIPIMPFLRIRSLPASSTQPSQTPSIVMDFAALILAPVFTLPCMTTSPTKSIFPVPTSTSPFISRIGRIIIRFLCLSILPSIAAVYVSPSTDLSKPRPTSGGSPLPFFAAITLPSTSIPSSPATGSQ